MRTTLLLLAFISLQAKAQWEWGVGLNPSYHFSTLTGDENPTNDSIDAILGGDWGYTVSMVWKKNLDRNTSIHFRPAYRQSGFLLTRDTLQYLDVVHPTLELINDLSQGAPKTAFMHHRFKSIGFDLEYQRDFFPEKIDQSYGLRWGAGISYFYMIEQDLRLKTTGFAIAEQNEHIIQSDLYFEGSAHRLAFKALVQGEVNINPKWIVFGQWNANAPFTLLTRDDSGIYAWDTGLLAGIRRKL